MPLKYILALKYTLKTNIFKWWLSTIYCVTFEQYNVVRMMKKLSWRFIFSNTYKWSTGKYTAHTHFIE